MVLAEMQYDLAEHAWGLESLNRNLFVLNMDVITFENQVCHAGVTVFSSLRDNVGS
jgi:hypothetical protein